MKWEDGVFIDTTLPFRLHSAPKIFTAVADAAEWILQQHGVHVVLYYLDDYLLIGHLRNATKPYPFCFSFSVIWAFLWHRIS